MQLVYNNKINNNSTEIIGLKNTFLLIFLAIYNKFNMCFLLHMFRYNII